MSANPEDIYRELVARHRISTGIAAGLDPATAVADALGRDPEFL